MELILLLIIALVVVGYRKGGKAGISKFFTSEVAAVYNKYFPYSYDMVKDKVKELGQDYTTKQYMTQVIMFAVGGFGISYLYFYNIFISICYGVVAVMFVPYLAYLRCQRLYSEYIFEQIQIYTTNTIMEFNTTQSFVKSLEGVRDSGILEDPVLTDVKHMIDMSYQNGTIDASLEFFSAKYPYYMVKNMHQLFLQITKEGAKDSGDALENMSLDIDALVEGVYRDQMDRKEFHKKFLTFGIILYFLVMTMQFLLGADQYRKMTELWYVKLILHAIIIINTYFLVKGEKFYNEDVGVE